MKELSERYLQATLKAAKKMVDPNVLLHPKDKRYVLVPMNLVTDLQEALSDLYKYLSNEVKKEPIVKQPKQLDIPPNVISTLTQYITWGIEISNFDVVEKTLLEYDDMDVLEYLHKYRSMYALIVDYIIGRIK